MSTNEKGVQRKAENKHLTCVRYIIRGNEVNDAVKVRQELGESGAPPLCVFALLIPAGPTTRQQTV